MSGDFEIQILDDIELDGIVGGRKKAAKKKVAKRKKVAKKRKANAVNNKSGRLLFVSQNAIDNSPAIDEL